MPGIINLSAYQFTPLENLPAWREQLMSVAVAGGLRGTILLSPEGINFFVAGERTPIEAMLVAIRTMPGLAGLSPKEIESYEQPFNRMLVKIKKEIIAFDVPGIDPARRPACKLPARTLKQWLDEGRPVTLLDTRNDYEIRLGTFRVAVPAGIENFRESPAAVGRLPAELMTQPIVIFCTGGIRCEKAGPYMEQAGFKQMLQLDGGILKYFEECGSAHYQGVCFVFDQRGSLDPALCPTPCLPT